ncbi:hypothetical protein OFM39_36250, partial [Escherichia coli]|nr:hypothetical protein [Escherichia coli]
SIKPKRSDYISPVGTSFGTDMESFDLKVRSVPLKLDGTAESSGFLTIGTIPIDPKALLLEKGKGVPNPIAKEGSQQK